MDQKKTILAAREAQHAEVIEAEVIDMPQGNLPALVERDIPMFVTVGKIPGEIIDVPFDNQMTIRELFKKIGIRNLNRCEIQRNGQEADLDDTVEPGDTVLAIARIRGNKVV